MKTDELIRGLAADADRTDGLAKTFLPMLSVGLVAAALLFSLTLHVRGDFPGMMLAPRVALKFAVTLSLAISALFLSFRLARPGAAAKPGAVALLVPVLVIAAGVGGEIAASPPDSWMPGLIGHNARYCVSLVPLMSAPVLAAVLLGLRRGAPTNPTLAGAVAGLVAGGFGAALYALHCTDDSPLFVLTWYSIAIAIITSLGALIGRRVLAW